MNRNVTVSINIIRVSSEKNLSDTFLAICTNICASHVCASWTK